MRHEKVVSLSDIYEQIIIVIVGLVALEFSCSQKIFSRCIVVVIVSLIEKRDIYLRYVYCLRAIVKNCLVHSARGPVMVMLW